MMGLHECGRVRGYGNHEKKKGNLDVVVLKRKKCGWIKAPRKEINNKN